MKAATVIVALLTGIGFGFGLAYSSMVRPEVILSFLRFEDFGLLLVLGVGNWPLLVSIAGMLAGAYVQGLLASRE